MSSIRPFSPPAAPVPGRPAARAPSEPAPVKAAQRAFFQAALDGSAKPEEPRGGAQARRVEPKPLDRLPRPGSLLDIKV